MSKKLLFAIIATICTTTAFADTKTVTTQSYVDNNFQTKIPVGNLIINGKKPIGVPNALVLYPTDAAGNIGEAGILDDDFVTATTITGSDAFYFIMQQTEYENLIPNAKAVRSALDYNLALKQDIIPASGHVGTESGNVYSYGDGSVDGDWLNAKVKGTGLVTRTPHNGIVGERQIIETADVANYGTGTATEQQIQEISIPTMGAVMAAISANAPTLPTGTAGNVVTYNASGQIGGSVATYNGSTTYNASTDASKIAVMSAVQRKMTCARYVQNAAETPENCLLWNVPD